VFLQPDAQRAGAQRHHNIVDGDTGGVVGDRKRARIERDGELVLRWTVDGQPETLVDVTLADAGEDRTRVVVVEIPVRVVQALGAEIGSGMFSGPMMVAA